MADVVYLPIFLGPRCSFHLAIPRSKSHGCLSFLDPLDYRGPRFYVRHIPQMEVVTPCLRLMYGWL